MFNGEIPGGSAANQHPQKRSHHSPVRDSRRSPAPDFQFGPEHAPIQLAPAREVDYAEPFALSVTLPPPVVAKAAAINLEQRIACAIDNENLPRGRKRVQLDADDEEPVRAKKMRTYKERPRVQVGPLPPPPSARGKIATKIGPPKAPSHTRGIPDGGNQAGPAAEERGASRADSGGAHMYAPKHQPAPAATPGSALGAREVGDVGMDDDVEDLPTIRQQVPATQDRYSAHDQPRQGTAPTKDKGKKRARNDEPLDFVRQETRWGVKDGFLKKADDPRNKNRRVHWNPSPPKTHKRDDMLKSAIAVWDAHPERQVRGGEMANAFRGMEEYLVNQPLPGRARVKKGRSSSRRTKVDSDESGSQSESEPDEHEPIDRMKVKRRSKADNQLKKHLRVCALRWMGRAHNEASFHLPDRSKVLTYEAVLKKDLGPSFTRTDYKTHPLLVDVTSSPTSAWNLRCSRLFAKQYVGLKEALSKDVHKIMKIFQTQIKGMKKAYIKTISDQLPAQELLRLKRSSLRQRENSRVKELSIRRLKCAERHPETRHLVAIMREAGRGSHSDDDLVQQDNVPTAKSRRLVWRSRRLQKVYHVCDALNIQDKYDEEGNIKSGLFPRPRVPGDQVSTRGAVKGLPRNCYDEVWLAQLDSDEIDDLRIRDEEADLHLCSELEELYEQMQQKAFNPARVVPLAKAGPSRRKSYDAIVSSESDSEAGMEV